MNSESDRTFVFMLADGAFRVSWRGRVASHTFNSKGAAQAFIAVCNSQNKMRS